MSYPINDQFDAGPLDKIIDRKASKEDELIENNTYEGVKVESHKKKEKGWFAEKYNKFMHIEGTYGEIPRPTSEIIEENREVIEEIQKLITDSQGENK